MMLPGFRLAGEMATREGKEDIEEREEEADGMKQGRNGGLLLCEKGGKWV